MLIAIVSDASSADKQQIIHQAENLFEISENLPWHIFLSLKAPGAS